MKLFPFDTNKIVAPEPCARAETETPCDAVKVTASVETPSIPVLTHLVYAIILFFVGCFLLVLAIVVVEVPNRKFVSAVLRTISARLNARAPCVLVHVCDSKKELTSPQR